MIICTSAFQELPLDKEGMVLRKFGITVLLFWRERERERKRRGEKKTGKRKRVKNKGKDKEEERRGVSLRILKLFMK